VTAPADRTARPRVIVTVGTDHHPFDRLITWTNDWLGTHPEQAAGFFVQSGTASVAPACAGERFLESGRLDNELAAADVIVSHGGPATIAAAWVRGLLPIVVPRVPRLGEHVDDHQVTFAVKLAELGRVRLAQTHAEFTSALAEATSDHGRFRAAVPAADVDAAVARFGELVEELVSRPRRRGRGQVSREPAPPRMTAVTLAPVSMPPAPISHATTNFDDTQAGPARAVGGTRAEEGDR
jgi:UDP-N-acetylglucosamine transferase subunit ALG13